LEPPPDHLGSHREIRTLPPPAGQNTRAGDVFFSSLLIQFLWSRRRPVRNTPLSMYAALKKLVPKVEVGFVAT
jgi:hypothetical protein